MSNQLHTKKHMTLSDRIFIEQSLADHSSFKDIASVLKKDPSTISKEIKKHRTLKEGSHYGIKNNCSLLSSCQSARICDGKTCNHLCKNSRVCDCTKHYAAFSPFVCPTLKKPPLCLPSSWMTPRAAPLCRCFAFCKGNLVPIPLRASFRLFSQTGDLNFQPLSLWNVTNTARTFLKSFIVTQMHPIKKDGWKKS